MNVLLMGLGFFPQNTHFKLLLKNRDIKNIYVYDDRPVLLSKFAKKNKVQPIKALEFDSIKGKIDFAIIAVERTRTYKYSKFILSHGINLLSEKPMALSLIQAKKLYKLSKLKKVTYEIGYQKNHDLNFLKIKKNLNNLIKKYGELTHIKFELYGGDFKMKKKTNIRTNEILKPCNFQFPKFLNNNLKINYMIFLNRYLHSLSLFFNLFDIKNFKNIRKIKAVHFNLYNSLINFLFQKKSVVFDFGNHQTFGWHDKLILFFKKAKIELIFKSPISFKKSEVKIYSDGNLIKNHFLKSENKPLNCFEDQLKQFIYKLKYKKKGNSYLSMKIHEFSDLIWKKMI